MNGEAIYLQQQALRTRLLDTSGTVSYLPARDLAAHLCLYLNNPLRVGNIAMQWLQERLEAERVDGGFGDPSDSEFVCGQWESDSVRLGVPSTKGARILNSDPLMQYTWGLSFPIAVDSVQNEPALNPTLRSALMATGTKSKIITPLRRRNGAAFALVSVDRTSCAKQSWRNEQLRNYHAVANEVIAPILEAAKLLSDDTLKPSERLADHFGQLTSAEIRVAKIAARGMGYKEIARVLERSVHTIDHQLRSIRQKLGLTTHAKLVEFLAHLQTDETSRTG